MRRFAAGSSQWDYNVIWMKPIISDFLALFINLNELQVRRFAGGSSEWDYKVILMQPMGLFTNLSELAIKKVCCGPANGSAMV